MVGPYAYGAGASRVAIVVVADVTHSQPDIFLANEINRLLKVGLIRGIYSVGYVISQRTRSASWQKALQLLFVK